MLVGPFAWGGTSTSAPAENQSTTITSQKMTVRHQENKAIFEGAVVLTKGALVVHSDVMVVFFNSGEQQASAGKAGERTVGVGKTEDSGSADKGARSGPSALPATGNRSVSMIEASGRVRIEKDEGRATCQKAIYYEDEEKIVLMGDPVAWQKGTRVSGKKITMYLAEERSVVEGESQVLIEPEQGDRR
jgi:lipopolysaccharide export system protein LptA